MLVYDDNSNIHLVEEIRVALWKCVHAYTLTHARIQWVIYIFGYCAPLFIRTILLSITTQLRMMMIHHVATKPSFSIRLVWKNFYDDDGNDDNGDNNMICVCVYCKKGLLFYEIRLLEMVDDDFMLIHWYIGIIKYRIDSIHWLDVIFKI